MSDSDLEVHSLASQVFDIPSWNFKELDSYFWLNQVLFPTKDVGSEDAFLQDIFVRHLPSSYLEHWYQDFEIDGVVGLTYGQGEDRIN